MKKSREELSRVHKERCKELKQIRAKMAENLGIDLKQRECTYEGYCSGTCLKCKNEELALNAAILKQQMEGVSLKAKVTAAGLTTAAAVCLSGCGLSDLQQTKDNKYGELDGAVEYIDDNRYGELEGDVEYIGELEDTMLPDTEDSDNECVNTESINTECGDSENME